MIGSRSAPATWMLAVLVIALLAVGLPTAAAALPDFGTEPVQETSSSGGSSIADVRVGANDGFDRFVVEFEGEIGAYFVSYVDQVTQDGSGFVVPVEGAAFVQVSLNGVPNQPLAPQDTIMATNTADPSATEASSVSTVTAMSPDVTPIEASEDSDSSTTWLLLVVIILVLTGIVAGIVGWRMRRPDGAQS
jgi:hypothetical protein